MYKLNNTGIEYLNNLLGEYKDKEYVIDKVQELFKNLENFDSFTTAYHSIKIDEYATIKVSTCAGLSLNITLSNVMYNKIENIKPNTIYNIEELDKDFITENYHGSIVLYFPHNPKEFSILDTNKLLVTDNALRESNDPKIGFILKELKGNTSFIYVQNNYYRYPDEGYIMFLTFNK